MCPVVPKTPCWYRCRRCEKPPRGLLRVRRPTGWFAQAGPGDRRFEGFRQRGDPERLEGWRCGQHRHRGNEMTTVAAISQKDSAMNDSIDPGERANQKLWRRRGAGISPPRGQRCHRSRRVYRHHGTIRLREIDVDEHPGLPRPADFGDLHPRRAGRQPAQQERSGSHPQPENRLYFSVFQPAAEDERIGQCDDALAVQPLRSPEREREAPAGRRGAQVGGAGRSHAPPPQPALRRSAAARGNRPGADQPAALDPGRRADRQPRFPLQRGHHELAAPASHPGHDHRAGDARSGCGGACAAGDHGKRRRSGQRSGGGQQ